MMEWILCVLFLWGLLFTGLWLRDRLRLSDANSEIKVISDKISWREDYIKSLCNELEQLRKPIPYVTTWYRDSQGCVTEAIPKGEDIRGAFKPLSYSGQLAVKTDKGIRMNENYVKPVYASNWTYPVAKNSIAAGSGRLMGSSSDPVLNLDNLDFITGFSGNDSDSKKSVSSDVCESTPSYGSIVEVNDCSSSYDSNSGSCDSGSSDSFGGND